MLPRLITFARAPLQLAEAEVAVGDEEAHAAQRGQRQCFPGAKATLGPSGGGRPGRALPFPVNNLPDSDAGARCHSEVRPSCKAFVTHPSRLFESPAERSRS